MADRVYNVLFVCTGNSARSIENLSELIKIRKDDPTLLMRQDDPKETSVAYAG